MLRLITSVLLVLLVTSCGDPDPKNNGSNNATSNNSISNNATSNNATTNGSTGTIPNARPSDCAADEKYVITCECGPANGCSGEVGRCLKTCTTDDDCVDGPCNAEGVCPVLCG